MQNPSVSSLPDYTILWAKSDPRHPLWKHLLDAAAVSLALPCPIHNNSWNDTALALLVGLHDIGKADSRFQYQDSGFSDELKAAGFPRTSDAPCRHERLSAEFVRKELVNDGLDEYVADAIARALVAHHGYWNEGPCGVSDIYKKAQDQLYCMLKKILRINSFPSQSPSNLSDFGMRLAGHVVLCDWIASNDEFFTDSRLEGCEDPVRYWTVAQEVAAEWTDKLSLKRVPRQAFACRVVENTRPIQEAVLKNNIPPGLVIIEAPMGEGKTEAAWILAEKWRGQGYHGMYMALPTMATSESLYYRYQNDYLGKISPKESARLIHGMAWLRDSEEPDKAPMVGEPGDDRDLAAAWFRPTRRAMLAAHGVGTVDQAMLAGMNVKFGFLRLYGLTDRVLVIDEVHAYDAYMSTIIARLLNWCACMRIPVIMLSATLSANHRKTMVEAYGASCNDLGPNAPYPLITVAEQGKVAKTISNISSSSPRTLMICTHDGLLGNVEETARLAESLVNEGGCCCVILNTVRQAQEVYQALKLRNNEKLLFHARFTAADRERITNQVLDMFGKGRTEGGYSKPARRPKKFVLVATQVVEQSLDVDFDHMISEIAPIDLLLQRSGRIKRHARAQDGMLKNTGKDDRGDPVLHVLTPRPDSLDFGGTSYVYALKPLLRTMAILAVTNRVVVPCDFRQLIERCYGTDEWDQPLISWDDIKKADDEWNIEIQTLCTKGRQFVLCKPTNKFFRPVNNTPSGDDSDDGNGWRAQTRLVTNDFSAVLVGKAELQTLKRGELDKHEVRTLYSRVVTIPSYLPISNPDTGYQAAIQGRGKLLGLVLLPVDETGSWKGKTDKGIIYHVVYDNKLGLKVRKDNG